MEDFLYWAKLICFLLISLVIGFGFWYGVGAFLFADINIFHWGWFARLVYLFFSFGSTGGILSLFLEK